ncbi:hypothetical protein DX873_15355 [Flagellimonas nanhaiensis]|uniref:Uncharacterized protein n=1 Tax=Flagellimonas nanhaiensis TaxID=2292706 RepID=A0A371JML0_9FLAO|nr:hypothetical protein DX873_15355 [Allomuricauda nanhaiensis]
MHIVPIKCFPWKIYMDASLLNSLIMSSQPLLESKGGEVIFILSLFIDDYKCQDHQITKCQDYQITTN